MALEIIFGLMVDNIWERGNRVNYTEKGCLLTKTEQSLTKSGIMVKKYPSDYFIKISFHSFILIIIKIMCFVNVFYVDLKTNLDSNF